GAANSGYFLTVTFTLEPAFSVVLGFLACLMTVPALPFADAFFVTLPSLQCTASSSVFAKALVSPVSFGTRHWTASLRSTVIAWLAVTRRCPNGLWHFSGLRQLADLDVAHELVDLARVDEA